MRVRPIWCRNLAVMAKSMVARNSTICDGGKDSEETRVNGEHLSSAIHCSV